MTERLKKGQKIERERLEMEGIIISTNNGTFEVKISENYSVLATLSGKIRINGIKVLVGDTVRVEVSEYDPNRGRIIYRMK